MTRWLAALKRGGYYKFSEGLRVEPTTVTPRGGVKLQTLSLLRLATLAQGEKEMQSKGPAYYHDDNDDNQREMRMRRLVKETATTGVATAMVCRRRCDNDHNYPEEEERLTLTTGDTTALGEGSHYDAMTRMTAMVITMQDIVQERSEDKRTTTLWDYVIRLTYELRLLLLLLLGWVVTFELPSCFSWNL